jgi:MoxR-like ATPase
MSDMITIDTLSDLINHFKADKGQRWYEDKHIPRLNSSVVQISEITRQFVNGKLNLRTYVNALHEAFQNTEESWSAKGNGFMMPLRKMIKNHDEKSPIAETRLRELLTDLNIENIGIKIEQLYDFLQKERKRLRNESKPNGSAAEAGKSATIISLFAFWLHPEQAPVVYHEDTRSGLAWLVTNGLLEPRLELHINSNIVIVTSNSDHQAFQSAINNLLNQYPELKRHSHWSEYFFSWLAGHKSKIIVNKRPDEPVITDGGGTPSPMLIGNNPLSPTLEPLLTQLIHIVQKHLLVDESTIRDIYHALLAGHVILSGPPGTGKTELARWIPELLWQRPENEDDDDDPEKVTLTKSTAYTTSLVTATDEWSVRTLISGIAPVSKDGNVAYKVQYGHLTRAILKNWLLQDENPDEWSSARRTLITSSSGIERGVQQIFHGQWLVIDEFNRAPIDLALGEALTALGGNDVLRVMTESGSMELPIPKDFRIIGTLNSFDRNYLNQISEALKRRFSFVEILPPGRSLRKAEQAIVLRKAQKQVSHLIEALSWESIIVQANSEGQYSIIGPDELHPFREAFEAAWRLFEVIRIYRQLGTAQAISLVRHMLIAGILQGYTTQEEWMSKALDAALCDTIADQLQVLLPDEIDALLLVLTHARDGFSAVYNRLLASLVDRPQRRERPVARLEPHQRRERRGLSLRRRG